MANGDTVASGNIKLGVDTTPMEQGLAAAQGKAVAQAQQIQQAVNSATVGGDDSDAYQRKLAEMAQRQHADVVRDLNDMLSGAETTASKVSATVGGATAKTQGFAESIKSATAGFRGFASAITSTVGAITGLLGIFGLLTAAVGTAVAAVESHFKALADYANAAKKAYEDYAKLVRSPLGGEDLNAHQRNIRQIQSERESRLDAAKAIYDEELAAALNLSGERRRTAVQDADFNRQRAEQQINNMASREIDAINKAKDRRDTAARQSSADQDRADAASGEKIGKIREKLREDEAEARRVADEALQEERKRDMEELMGYWTDIQNKADDERASFQRDLMRQQQEQLAQLRNDINALYSSGNLEVGIGRVASLLETLIAKTEGRR